MIALWHRKDSSDHLAEHFEKSLKVFCPVTELLKVLKRFQEKRYKYSIKMFPWTPWMQFWQPCRKVFAKKSKNCSPNVQKKEGNFQKTKKILRFFYRHLKCCFDNPTWNVSTKSRNFFKNVLLKKLKIPQKTIFISECSIGHVECSSDNPAWLCLPKSPKFVSQGPENTGKKQKFLQDCPMA